MLREAGMSEEDIRHALKLDQTRSRSNPSASYTNSRAAMSVDEVMAAPSAPLVAAETTRRRAGSFTELNGYRAPLNRQSSPVTPSVRLYFVFIFRFCWS